MKYIIILEFKNLSHVRTCLFSDFFKVLNNHNKPHTFCIKLLHFNTSNAYSHKPFVFIRFIDVVEM